MKHYYIIRIFAVLLVLFLLMLSGAGLGIYGYARQAVGAEFRRLNQASLAQLSDALGKSLTDVIRYGEKVSVSSRILQAADPGDETAQREIHAALSLLQSEFNEFHTAGRTRLETYVCLPNGLTASAMNSEGFNWEVLRADEQLAPLFSGDLDMVLLPTVYHEDRSGIMTYSFQMVFAMRDLLSREERGLVVLDVSELLLYEQYQRYYKDEAELCVITPDGSIISDKSKQMIGTEHALNQQALQSTQSLNERLVFSARIPGSTWILVETIPEQTAYGALTKLRNVVLGIVVLTVLFFALAVILVSRQLLGRVMRIRNKMSKVIEGDLTVRIPDTRDDEIGQIERDFNSMVSQIDQLLRQTRQSEHEKRMAEMDFLHAQINSHFIHNTLTSIRFMLEMGKTQQAGEMIFFFSRLLRRTLSRSAEFVPLSEEIETLESYLKVQQYRYPNTFEAHCEIAPETKEALVPTMILQPVVENAIIHGGGRAPVHVTISAHRQKDLLIMEVSDDGVGMSQEQQNTVLHKHVQFNHVGLRNVHERLQLNYGQEYGLEIQSKLGAGTRIRYLLPYTAMEGETEE